MSPQTPSSPDLIHQRIRRKPPPSLDISERYPSPDPLDPFAPLWVLRNRTSSGLSTQDVLESNIISRTRSNSYLYSTTTAQVSVNTSISPIPTPSPKAKIGHYRPYSQTTVIDSPQVFPLISSPLASQPDLLCRQQPFADRRTNVRLPRQTLDLYDSSGTESDTASVPFPSHKTEFIQPNRTSSSNYRFSKFLLLRKASFLGSGKPATGHRSSMIEFKQIQKLNISPPVVSTVTWIPTSLSADLPDCGSISDEDVHHQHHKRHLVTSDGRNDLKQDFSRLRKLPLISVSPKVLRKKMPSSNPFSSKIRVSPSTHSVSSSSYVHISTPQPVLSCSQPTSEDAYTSPRKAPIPPPAPATLQEQASEECPNKSCGENFTSSEWDTPTLLQLNYAANLQITGDDGKHITFGSLFESQRTIVIFIRHFWCPLCQDYMSSVKSLLRPEMVCNTCESGVDHRSQSQNHGTTECGGDCEAGTRVRFVVISNGAHGMIAKYRQIFGLPFKVYTDPTLALYQALGMGRDGDLRQTHRHSTSEGGSSDVISEKNLDINKNGGYVKHGLMGGIAMVVMRALKVCMPVWEKGGDIGQLGGEFIFGPGLTCRYAHRMQTTKGHASIEDVLKAAGISAPNRTLSSAEGRRVQPESTAVGWPTSFTSEKGPRKRRESMKTLGDKESSQLGFIKRVSRRYSIGMMSREEEDRWMEHRVNSIDRLQEKKNMRRGMSRVAGSMQSQSSPQLLETMGEIGDEDREERGPITRVVENWEGESSPTPTPTMFNDLLKRTVVS
ncbi:hypothetical protein BYT27DRAFT_7239309 [Phlegmacium glaucopus]|nr:hypothetical protein BYT27DRAFT_7239309 [Phlegmacium glaucopus]